MYRKNPPTKNTIKRNESYQGERIELKVVRMTTNKEQVDGTVPLIYTDRKLGVQPGFNPRTDRFEVAIDAMDRRSKKILAQREARMNPVENTTATGDGTTVDVKGGKSGA